MLKGIIKIYLANTGDNRKYARLIDSFIAELMLAANIEEIGEENIKLSKQVFFTPTEMHIKYDNRICSDITIEYCGEEEGLGRIIVPNCYNGREGWGEGGEGKGGRGERKENWEFDKIFDEQRGLDKGVKNFDGDRKGLNVDGNGQTSSTKEGWEDYLREYSQYTKTNNLKLLESQNRKLFAKLNMLHNRSVSSLSDQFHRGSLKEILVGSIYFNSEACPTPPQHLSAPFRVS
jgi:hypothetical protein